MHNAYRQNSSRAPSNWEAHFRGSRTRKVQSQFGCDCEPKGSKFGGTFDSQNTENLNAVNDYMHHTVAKTAQAKALQSDWVRWWESTGNPDLSWFAPSNLLWDEARNRRLAFDTANATTPEESAAVKQQAATGISSEQAQGAPDRRDPTTGQYYVPPVQTVPDWVKPVVIGALAIGLGISAFPLLRKLILPI